MSCATTMDQVARFTTDAVGLERIFRFLQAIVQIISSYPFALDLLLQLLTLTTPLPPSPSATRTILQQLHQRLGLARRYFRLFRSVDSFHAANKLYAGILSPITTTTAPTTRAWLDVLARTCNGMWFLLDAATVLEALQVPGLRLWSPAWERVLAVEAQRFWLFGLACGALSGVLRMRELWTETSSSVAPTAAAAAADGRRDEGEKQAAGTQSDKVSAMTTANEDVSWSGRIAQVRRKAPGLMRSTFANALDVVVPGSVIGWVKLGPGPVGVAMLVTTYLTGMEAWERCGREVSGK
ncbi:peroxisomal biogenesis factor 11 [Xylariaceae sp. FL0016]|nr:peroxisomal biogenesis factor 11 [Xylariaceae sp. FL0016]